MPSVSTARRLRRDSTDAELKLWQRLRDRRLDGLKFKRQVIIEGKIADFACNDAKLIVEIDGGQHALREAEDRERTLVLERAGFLVIRFWNNDVLSNIEGVLQAILDATVAARRHPSPCPSPQRRGDA